MQTMNTSQLKLLLEGSGGKLALINTLPEAAFPATKIPDSENVPLEDENFEQRVEEIADGKIQPVVVYSANEECDASTRAAEKLTAAGFTDVWDYQGGAQAWKEAEQESA